MSGLYEKYRVFREPEDADSHPVPIMPPLYTSNDPEYSGTEGRWRGMKEVSEFTFVLKPGTDPHAVTALVAYAAACRKDDQDLSIDLLGLMDDYL